MLEDVLNRAKGLAVMAFGEQTAMPPVQPPAGA
jgi:hypothetical protein